MKLMILLGDAPCLNMSRADPSIISTRSTLSPAASKSAVRSIAFMTMLRSSLAPVSPDLKICRLKRIFMHMLYSPALAVPISFLICVATAFCASSLLFRSLSARGHNSRERKATALSRTDASAVMSSSIAVVVACTSFSSAAHSASLTTATSFSFSDSRSCASTPTSFETTVAGADEPMCLKLSIAFMRYVSPSSKRSMRMSSTVSA
mmetsp:Transcript_39193/g.76645  ORF Transcript_39193/g.76645 Transcript_39193/m.76645 type:complete len:207 (+) Transcript_39193:610-1230(+)